MSLVTEKTLNRIVLLSGGLDSATVAYLASKKAESYLKHRVFTLTFDYGQRHKKELESADQISKNIGAAVHKVVKFDLTSWGGSSLTDRGLLIPRARKFFKSQSKKLTLESIPNTYVPARNTIFLSFALSYAEAIGAQEIYIGVNSVDYSGYVDCRPRFIKKYQELIKLATVKRPNGKVIKIKTPLINLSKAQIITLGKKLGVDWKLTWSCYLGGKDACGLCDSCHLRLKGFLEARVIDPISYKLLPRFYEEWLGK